MFWAVGFFGQEYRGMQSLCAGYRGAAPCWGPVSYTHLDCIIAQMKEVEGITEELKARDQMAWVRAMNSIRNRAEEIIRSEMIYC